MLKPLSSSPDSSPMFGRLDSKSKRMAETPEKIVPRLMLEAVDPITVPSEEITAGQ